MHPACPNKKQNHLQNSLLRRTQFWVRNTFSKPASLKRASLVALPVAISHKVSLKPKLCASATLIQKTSKNEPKHGPKNGTAWRSHFWDRMHSLVKEQKKSTFTVPFLGPSGGTKNETAKSQNPQQRPTLEQKKSTLSNHGPIRFERRRQAVPKMRPQNRKIHSKGRPLQQTKNCNCIYLSNQHIDLEQRRPAHAKPDFN